MSEPERQSADRLDVVVRGGRVLDPGCGVDAVLDVGIAGGRIARLERVIGRGVARRVVDARGKLVIPGMIDTHAHVVDAPPARGHGGRGQGEPARLAVPGPLPRSACLRTARRLRTE